MFMDTCLWTHVSSHFLACWMFGVVRKTFKLGKASADKACCCLVLRKRLVGREPFSNSRRVAWIANVRFDRIGKVARALILTLHSFYEFSVFAGLF